MAQWDENGNLIEEEPAQQAQGAPRRRQWDENGNEVTGQAEAPRSQRAQPQTRRTPPNQGEDILRSFVAGLPRGVAQIAGMRGDFARAQDQLTESLVRGLGGNETALNVANTINRAGRQALLPDLNDAISRPFTSDQAIKAIEAIPVVGHVAQYEPQTRLGRYARTAGEFAPGVIMPGGVGRTAARRLGSNLLTTEAAAIASEAAGQATEGSDLEPIARLGGAVLGGHGAHSAQNMLARGARTAPERAVRIIDRRMRQGDTTIDELDATARGLRRQGGDTAETIAEVGGKPLQRAARAVATVDGPGQSIADTFLEERASGLTGRVLGEATRATAPRQTRAPRNFYDAQEMLRRARAGQGAEAYRAAHAQDVPQDVVQNELLPLMQRGPRQAVTSAINQLESAGLRAQTELAIARRAQDVDAIARAQADLDGVTEAITQLRAVGGGQVPNRLGVRALDYYQRGLGQLADAAGYRSPEGSAMEGARQTFNTLLDRVAPQFGEARSNYGASMRVEELMGEGRRVFNMPEGEIELLLRGRNGQGLTTEEFDGFMLGVMDALETKLRAGDTAFVARFMRNQNWQRQLERAFTPSEDEARRALTANRRRSRSTAAIRPQDIQRQQQRMARQSVQRLQNRIAREANMRAFDNAVRRGSQTTPIAEDIKGMTSGESELSFIGEVIQGGGNVKGPVVRLLAGAWDRLHRPGIYNPEVNRELAQRLFQPATTGNVAHLRRELAALKQRGIAIDASIGRDLIRAAILVRQDSKRDRERSVADYSDEELERIAAGAN